MKTPTLIVLVDSIAGLRVSRGQLLSFLSQRKENKIRTKIGLELRWRHNGTPINKFSYLQETRWRRKFGIEQDSSSPRDHFLLESFPEMSRLRSRVGAKTDSTRAVLVVRMSTEESRSRLLGLVPTRTIETEYIAITMGAVWYGNIHGISYLG